MQVDAFLLRGLAIAVLAAVLIPLVSRTPTLAGLALIGLPAAAVYYGPDVSGFLILCVLGYLAAQLLGAIDDPVRRWRVTGLAIGVLAVAFTLGRVRHWESATATAGTFQLPLLVLDMWLALRLVTLFWEVGSGAVPPPSPASYAGWVTFPMTLGGPLVRYSELPGRLVTDRSLWRAPRWWRQLGEGAVKLSAGVVLTNLPSWIPDHTLSGIVRVLVGGPIGFYLTLAGYFHLMQALAAPIGIAIPDSFNWPIGRENISAFWANWNMTATRVFRDYLFFNRWGLKRHNVYVNTLILFVLVGLWHGANAYWAIFGLLHGVMFSLFLAWRQWKSTHGMRGAPPMWSLADTIGRVATYMAVCAAWYLPAKILEWLGVI